MNNSNLDRLSWIDAYIPLKPDNDGWLDILGVPEEWVGVFKQDLRTDGINDSDSRKLAANPDASRALIAALHGWSLIRQNFPSLRIAARRKKLQRHMVCLEGLIEDIRVELPTKQRGGVGLDRYEETFRQYTWKLSVLKEHAKGLWEHFGGSESWQAGRPRDQKRDVEADEQVLEELWSNGLCDSACYKLLRAAMVASGAKPQPLNWYTRLAAKHKDIDRREVIQ
jgi:hypothetical protein